VGAPIACSPVDAEALLVFSFHVITSVRCPCRLPASRTAPDRIPLEPASFSPELSMTPPINIDAESKPSSSSPLHSSHTFV
ncbi:MAG TPA: hypothetical protein VF450_17975, partial [Noviherbaspirillum sp.]